MEELLRPGTAGCGMRQHRVGCIEAGKQNEIGQQENPEAVAGDDAVGRRSFVAAVRLVVTKLVRIVLRPLFRYGRPDTGFASFDKTDTRLTPLVIDPGDFV